MDDDYDDSPTQAEYEEEQRLESMTREERLAERMVQAFEGSDKDSIEEQMCELVALVREEEAAFQSAAAERERWAQWAAKNGGERRAGK